LQNSVEQLAVAMSREIDCTYFVGLVGHPDSSSQIS